MHVSNHPPLEGRARGRAIKPHPTAVNAFSWEGRFPTKAWKHAIHLSQPSTKWEAGIRVDARILLVQHFHFVSRKTLIS